MKRLAIILLPVLAVLAAVLVFTAGSSDTARADPDSCPQVPQHSKCEQASSEATHTIVITSPPLGPVTCGSGDLKGLTRISRTDDDDTIDTEIVQMELTGVCSGGGGVDEDGAIPIAIFESATRHSTGTITEVAPIINGTLDFPADSFFDVFVEIDTPLGTLHNAVPAEMECEINSLPPYGCEYQIQNAPIPLLNEADQVVGSLTEATHTLLGPVGGTTELLVGGSDASAGASDGSGGSFPYAAVAAAGALALAAGGWYARRRWLR